MDPSVDPKKWTPLVRFYINVDISLILERAVYIPNENMELQAYNLWLEELQEGCDYGSGLDHLHKNCPNRKYTPPTFQFTLKKSHSQKTHTQASNDMDNSYGTQVTKKKGLLGSPAVSKPNLSSNFLQEHSGGFSKVYISEESSVDSKESSKLSSDVPRPTTPTAIATKNDLPLRKSENHDPPQNMPHTKPQEKIILVTYLVVEEPNPPKPDSPENPINFPIVAKPDDEGVETNVSNTTINLSPPQEHFMDDQDDQVQYYYDDEELVVDDYQRNFLNDEEPLFRDKLHSLINDVPLPEMPNEDNLSFFSINSDNSVIQKMINMEMQLNEPTSSESSKRKNQGGVADTASSNLMGNKTPKI